MSSPAPSPSPAEQDERERIEAAFTAVVAQRGLRESTVAAVCERAGVEVEDFHRHFADLEGCFTAVIDRFREAFMEYVGAAFIAEQGWRNQIRAVAYAILRFFQADPDRARLMVVEPLSAGPGPQLVRDQGMEALFELIDLGRAEMEEPESLTRATAEAIGGAIFHQIRVAIEAGDLSVGDRMVPQLMYTVVLPYLGTEAAMEELRIEPPPVR